MTPAPELDLWRHKLTEAINRNTAGHPIAARRAFSALARTIEASGDTRPEVVVLRSRAHLGLATSTFDQRGELAAALRDIDIAERLARAAGAPHVLVAVLGQRGLVHLGSGDTARALQAFDAAADLLDTAEPFDQMCILLNRGALHLEHGSLAAARSDLTRCTAIATSSGDHVLEFKARHNLGYVEFLAGNLPRALGEMAAAATVDSGGPWPTALLDQARVLREAGLTSEADTALRTAQALFAADRLKQGVAETVLVRAECALAADPQAARALAVQAGRLFRRRGNLRWERKAEALALTAELAAADAGTPARLRGLATRAARFADLCSAEGRDDLARSARLVHATALLSAGQPLPPDDRPWLALHRRDPLAVRLQVREVRARAALVDGDPAAAGLQVRRGLAEVSAYQARFGSLDMRTASAVHGVALARLDLELALATGRPSAVFASIERTRAASSRLAPVQPPEDDAAAALLAELRLVEEEARGLEGSGDAKDLGRLRSRAAELRSAVRARAWRREGSRDKRAVRATATPAAVRERLAESGAAFISITAHQGEWHAVVLDDRGVAHRVLGPVAGTDELVRRTLADLDALALPLLPAGIRDSVAGSLHAGLAALDAALLEPLGLDGRHLVVSPTGLLAVLPWSLLPSRRGLPVVVVPSASSWLSATSPVAPVARPTRTALRMAGVAGPGLTRAADEATTIARTWAGTTITGADATTKAVIDALATHDVVHIAAHGRHEPENPLFSSLRLVDGSLYAHELDSASAIASCLVLSACEVGLWTVRPGDEALGLTSVLLQLGVRSVVAGVARVSDAVAEDVMVRMHALMATGVDSATALASTQAELKDGAVAPFVCFGASWAAPRG